MALVVNIKCVENLPGKSDRVVKVSFRGLCQQSNVVKNAKKVAYFGQTFEWPVARPCEEDECLLIEICNFNKYLTNKVVGTYTLLLQQLIIDGELKIYEPLVGANYRTLETTITFEVNYYSPDGKVGRWRQEEFSYPLTDDTSSIKMGEDAMSVLSGTRRDLPEILDETHALRFAPETRSENGSHAGFGGSMLDGMFPGEDTASQTAMVDTLFDNKKRRPDLLEQELHKPRDFQICVTIVEAQQLAGLNVDPVIKVEVGDEHKYTSIKQSTNCPYFNEYFVFDFKESPAMLFDKIVTITAYHAYNIPGRQLLKTTNTVAGKRVIGSFRCDVGTVFSAPDHMYYHKWAVLLNAQDIAEGPRGFVKCDISVIGRGDSVKIPKGIREEDTNNIEGNLLLPAGVPMQRQRAVYTMTIYRAEDLPRTDLGIMASVRKAMSLGTVAFVDAFVRVSFVGLVGKTTVRKSYDPEWKEVLQFQDMFPPLCNRIKIQLCDSDAVRDGTIATHFMELSQIMDPGGDTEGILPTFGPSWINFYGAPRNYKIISENEELNDGLGEGSAYRGRLLISLTTTLIEDDMGGGSSVSRTKLLRTGGVMDYQPRKQFLLHSTIFEATMIDRELKDKPVQFEISMGQYGNVLDAKADKGMINLDDDDDDDDDDDGEAGNASSSLLKKRREEEQKLPCHSITEAMNPASQDNVHYYMPFAECKPCVYVCSLYEDVRKRLYHSNLLERVVDKLDEGLDDVKQMIYNEHEFTHRRIRGVMAEFISGSENYLTQCGSLGIGAGSGKTKLDKYRLRACRNHMDKFKNRATEMKRTVRPFNVKDFYKEGRDIARKLRHLIKEPQQSLPDVFIWMVSDKKRIAYYRIPARDVLFTTLSHFIGKHSGKRQTIFFRKPGKKGLGQSGWTMQAKMDLVVWLGEFEHRKKEQPYLQSLPKGFEPEFGLGPSCPATGISYNESHNFQLRAYIFQARSLIGSDSTGLSDPFARVIVSNQCKSTRHVEETLSPGWDQTLVFNDVVLCAPLEAIKKTPLVVTVEIYDYDVVGDPEFLGRVMVTPKVKLEDEPYTLPDWPPQLEWFDVYRGTKLAGELLAAFELLQGTEGTLPPLVVTEERRKGILVSSIPPSIKPTLSKYRIEVLFWGMRDMKRIHLLSVDRPRMDVECAGHFLNSKRIENMEKNCNFEHTVMAMDVFLPDNEMYWPPLTFRCVDSRSFGRETLVGVATINQLPNYIYQSPEERKQREAERRRRQLEQLQAMQGDLAGSSASVGPSSIANGSHVANGSAVAVLGDVAIEIENASVHSANNRPRSIAGSLARGQNANNMTGSIASGRTGKNGSIYKDHVSINMSLAGAGAGTQPEQITHPANAGTPTQPAVPGVSVVPTQETREIAEIQAIPMEVTFDNDKPKEATALKQAAAKEAKKDEVKKPMKRKELIAELDWWSKYYVTNEDIEKHWRKIERKGDKDSKDNKEVFSDGNDSDLSSDEGLGMAINAIDYSAIDHSQLNKIKEVMIAKRKEKEAEMEKMSGKKKKKKSKLKKLKDAKKSMKKLTGIVNDAFSKEGEEEEMDELDLDEEEAEDKSHIIRIRKYFCELEKAAGFGGFGEMFHHFTLYRGKKVDDEEEDMNRITGKFKGNVCVYKLDGTEEEITDDSATSVKEKVKDLLPVPKLHEDKDKDKPHRALKYKLQVGLPSPKPFEVRVMVYIIKATDLHPVDLNGKADPYLVVRCGRQQVNDKENKICNQLNPVFGKLYEFDVAFPMDSMLHIKVMDYDLLSADDLIGDTTIDLENRFFSKHRPRCGLQQEYEVFGYNIWRDPMKPTMILEKMCKDNHLEPPLYKPTSVYVGGQTFEGSGSIEMEGGELLNSTEHLALEALKNWDDVTGYSLVPEHIECRPLYNDERPGVEQGALEMWVDMFPKDMPTPSVTVDVTPRLPKGYELRCIIWNTDDVILEDTNILTGEESSDIFVKGYLKGKGEDDQSTDVHYRSLTGEGNFNWRYVFPFDYLKAEEKIMYKKSEGSFDMSETEVKVPPKLTLQIWDADLVSADDFLGACTMDLNRLPRPSKDAKNCKVRKAGSPTLNLFKNKRCRGWWPVTTTSEEGKQKIMGKIEAELSLLTQEEAERTPCGLGREDPEGLPEPNRPDSSFLWFMNPLKTLKYIIWKNYKWLILKIFLVLLLIAFIALMIYAAPGEITKKVFGNG